MQPLYKSDIVKVFRDLGVTGQRVVVHASLRNVGYIDGGAYTVLEAIRECIHTCVMPAYSFQSIVAPPTEDRPLRNGIDYTSFRTLVIPTPPFCIESAPVDKKLGSLAAKFAAMKGVSRSDHPWASYAAWGVDGAELTSPYPWMDGALSMERLIDKGGYVVLMGVTLTSCSAIHVACKRTGRNDFIRWALSRDGEVRRLRTGGGCAKGFDKLLPMCKHLFRHGKVGMADVLVAYLPELITYCQQLILSDPEITRCSPDCLRCNDSILGGPLE